MLWHDKGDDNLHVGMGRVFVRGAYTSIACACVCVRLMCEWDKDLWYVK